MTSNAAVIAHIRYWQWKAMILGAKKAIRGEHPTWSEAEGWAILDQARIPIW